MKYVPPSVKETAFNCPHCGAFAQQFWNSVYLDLNSDEHPMPGVYTQQDYDALEFAANDNSQERRDIEEWLAEMIVGVPFIEVNSSSTLSRRKLSNCNVSVCYNCDRPSVWVHDNLSYPIVGNVLAPNPDMPDDIKRDYSEAGSILNQSPRGAAALLRLAIQKLCKELGQPGENINSDIKALVAAGLDKRVQQALDAVRVIGNSAVHPGKIDIRDDRATAESLFRLINLIVDKTISEPKHVQEVYDSLPGNLLEAITNRDATKS
ncbi:DUF4145 domain-containing protein [Pseudomonas sp. 24 R 17]|uniref:DUF4145 domain-containing protein n=1 Tax=Pseudomonas sp. 24 R 17 TaxID=1844096 RepID=UPI0008122272|nr:DUF4145 domain-containing protein [Pseudomonas sp. 24 R 17]CRM18736.1 hypothetical protein [Pseudomonas sp. 24 R 17]CRM46611.1 hypothetical protein [Pseudomonas sp. 24 R 17]